MASGSSKFHLLEINLISAQDIAKVTKSMQTYAVAWVHPDRKLTTKTDTEGGTNPTWNDKFVFRVDSQFLDSDSSAVMIEIYVPNWFKPIHVGTVRVLVGNLIPPQTRSNNKKQNQLGMRFVALQVRRSSGRPQGILNVGVTVLDSTMRSMPLYTLLSSSAGYQKFVGQDDGGGNKGSTSNNQAELRRSTSENSSIVNSKGGSIVNMPTTHFANNKDIGSIVEANKKGTRKHKDDNYDKPLSIVDGDRSDLGLAATLKAQDGKADSVLSSSSSIRRSRRRTHRRSPSSVASKSNIGLPPLIKHINKNNHNHNNTSNKSSPNKGYNNNYREYPTVKNSSAGSVLSVSDIGPSPSEVAAAIAEDSKYREGGRSMLEYEPSEGVGTRLEKWRRDQPNNGYEYNPSSRDGSSLVFAGGNKHRHRRKDGGGDDADGRFKCFGNICGYECSIVCGSDVGPKKKKKGGKRDRSKPPPSSAETASTYF